MENLLLLLVPVAGLLGVAYLGHRTLQSVKDLPRQDGKPEVTEVKPDVLFGDPATQRIRTFASTNELKDWADARHHILQDHVIHTAPGFLVMQDPLLAEVKPSWSARMVLHPNKRHKSEVRESVKTTTVPRPKER